MLSCFHCIMGAHVTNNNNNKTVNKTVIIVPTNSSIYVDCSNGNDTNNGSANYPKKQLKQD